MAEPSLVVDRTDVDTAVADRPTTTPVRRDSRHDRVRRRRQLSSILRTALILAGALIMLFPFAWMVATSLTNTPRSRLFTEQVLLYAFWKKRKLAVPTSSSPVQKMTKTTS